MTVKYTDNYMINAVLVIKMKFVFVLLVAVIKLNLCIGLNELRKSIILYLYMSNL